MRLIGDVHGNMHAYKEAIRGCEQSIQLGDFGVGFMPIQELLDLDYEQPYHKFFTGNHDNDVLAQEFKRNIGSGPLREGVFVVRGAWSIDHELRTPGIDWWVEEQHTQGELDALYERYVHEKPEIMLTHDCPTLVAYHAFIRNNRFRGYYGGEKILHFSKTGEALQKMFEAHQPREWYFGHYHFSTSVTIDNTNFQCLNINECKDIDW